MTIRSSISIVRPVILILFLIAVTGCGGRDAVVYRDEGIAAVYPEASAGRTTTSGEVHRADRLTAAHRTLPIGTLVRITNLTNDRQVIVSINDRGPRNADHLILLSRRAAGELDFLRSGLARVRVETME